MQNPYQSLFQVFLTAAQVNQSPKALRGKINGHCVYGEITTQEVVFNRTGFYIRQGAGVGIAFKAGRGDVYTPAVPVYLGGIETLVDGDFAGCFNRQFLCQGYGVAFHH